MYGLNKRVPEYFSSNWLKILEKEIAEAKKPSKKFGLFRRLKNNT